MNIFTSIIPLFLIIGLGCMSRKWELITAEFLKPANRLVFYISIPAFLFHAVSQGTPGDHFDGVTTSLTLACAASAYLLGHTLTRIFSYPGSVAGTFIQSSAHGNQGYIGLAVVFYYLGQGSVGIAAILCGFLMILQNILSVFFLQTHTNYTATSSSRLSQLADIGSKLKSNPVILSVTAGLIVSSTGIELPLVIKKTLSILGGLAPPLALLLIGASLSLSLIHNYFRLSLLSALIKLFLLPLAALPLFILFGISMDHFLPAMILLAAPTATVTYVMAGEMGGQPDFAVATISFSTLASCISYPLWLAILATLP